MKKQKLSTLDMAFELRVSPQTIKNWYKWYNSANLIKPEGMPELPKYKKEANGKRVWKPEDISKLKKFAKWVPKGRAGVMGDTNFKAWGDRGKRAQKNKKEKQKQTK